MEDALREAVRAQVAGDIEGARRLYERGLAGQAPIVARHKLGVALASLNMFGAAEKAFREALQIDPTFAPTRYVLGEMLLSLGRYAEGWQFYEARRGQPTSPEPTATTPLLSCPEWQGEDLSGKKLIVFTEQGFGDILMFGRFIERLHADGVDVTYFGPAAVAPLIPGTVNVPRAEHVTSADYWTLLCTLPLRMGATLGSLPPPLSVRVPHTAGGGVGVMARGRAEFANDRHRSLGPADAARLLALGRDLSPEATGAKDFLDTAKIVADLDVVVTVDTSVAHLAGSMGKPCWVLLPAEGTDWRWMCDRADSPWYPSVKLYRQARAGVWDDVIADVQRDLATFTATR